jgi:hypothetical protein
MNGIVKYCKGQARPDLRVLFVKLNELVQSLDVQNDWEVALAGATREDVEQLQQTLSTMEGKYTMRLLEVEKEYENLLNEFRETKILPENFQVSHGLQPCCNCYLGSPKIEG